MVCVLLKFKFKRVPNIGRYYVMARVVRNYENVKYNKLFFQSIVTLVIYRLVVVVLVIHGFMASESIYFCPWQVFDGLQFGPVKMKISVSSVYENRLILYERYFLLLFHTLNDLHKNRLIFSNINVPKSGSSSPQISIFRTLSRFQPPDDVIAKNLRREQKVPSVMHVHT